MNGQLQIDAAVLQERDRFTGAGWLKVIAPAKVNLRLAIGARRDDGYHDAVSIMHALALHDTVFLRIAFAASNNEQNVSIAMIGCGDVEAPEVPPEKNIAVRAAHALREALGDRVPDAAQQSVQIRIEKNIPAQAGLGGGSTDAAAVLVGLARLWGIDPDDADVVRIARTLGADVAFFLKGGCAYLDGVGDHFDHALKPRHDNIVLVKPAGGISTAAAYTTFDNNPVLIDTKAAACARDARDAVEIELFNNLAPAAEALMPELAQIRTWLAEQPGVSGALLCGSGSATFAVCDSFDAACRIAASARTQNLWTRTTAFSPIGAAIC